MPCYSSASQAQEKTTGLHQSPRLQQHQSPCSRLDMLPQLFTLLTNQVQPMVACPATPHLPKPRRRPPGFTDYQELKHNLAVLHADIIAPLAPPSVCKPPGNAGPAAAAQAGVSEPRKPRRRPSGFEAFPAHYPNLPLVQKGIAAPAVLSAHTPESNAESTTLTAGHAAVAQEAKPRRRPPGLSQQHMQPSLQAGGRCCTIVPVSHAHPARECASRKPLSG